MRHRKSNLYVRKIYHGVSNKIFFFFFLFTFGAFAQAIQIPLDYYPLQVGNEWIYKEVTVYNNDTTDLNRYRFEKIVGDTLLSDGFLYYVVNFWYSSVVIHKKLNRIDSTLKIVYDEYGYEEYNLGANPDSNWIDNSGMPNRLFYDTTLITGLNITRPNIIFEQGIFYFNRTLAEGIGLCFAEYGDLGHHTLDYLVYAKVNGFEYGTLVGVEDKVIFPIKFLLSQNYPNPFNPSTKISYSVEEGGLVSLKVYDVLGNEITILVNEEKPAGKYEVEFNAANLPSGIYFYKLQTDNFSGIRKMILLR